MMYWWCKIRSLWNADGNKVKSGDIDGEVLSSEEMLRKVKDDEELYPEIRSDRIVKK